MSSFVLDADAYAELVRRLVSLRKLAAELADAYEDPVSRAGAEEVQASVERALELLGQD